MDGVSAWARQLIYLVIFATVAEVLLPAGEVRRYVKMVLGLVVVVSIVSPLINLVKGAAWLEPLFYTELPAAADGAAAIESGVQMQEKAMTQAAAEARQGAAGVLRAFLMTIDEVTGVSVDLAPARPVIAVQVAADTGRTAEKVRQMAAAYLEMPPAEIDVRIDQPAAAAPKSGGR